MRRTGQYKQPMVGFSGLRKGAWTREEDDLLKRCVEKYGEGKWHQVPSRAGLNRCRKSCRLRWLNYLKPDIKRGEFSVDEVDLLLRLHKLLGNRWSLIAGRLPGRTANDVKNYWNTHLQKKYGKHIIKADNNDHQKMATIEPSVIRPRPRTFTKGLPWMNSSTQKASSSTMMTMVDSGIHHQEENHGQPILSDSPLEKDVNWWESLLNDTLEVSNSQNIFSISGSDGEPNNNMATFSVEDAEPAVAQVSNGIGEVFVEDHQSFWRNFFMNIDPCDL